MNFKKFLYSLSVFVGTIIGVGLFGLPFVSLQSGILTVLIYFIFIGALVLLIHLLFGEIALRTPGVHRLPGYVDIYLGKKSKKFVLFSTVFGFYGALLAYIIVGGGFLWDVLWPFFGGSEWVYQTAFFVLGSLLVWRGTVAIAKTELFFLVVFFVMLFFLLFLGVDKIQIQNFQLFDLKNIFLPYGVILFSLWGISAVPETRDLLKGDEKLLKYVLIGGIILSAIVYCLFVVVVLGVSGATTTKDAILGLKNFLPNGVIALGMLFGIVTTFTSFLSLGLTLKKIFNFDYHFSSALSLALACGVPFVLFLLGFRQFISILGLVGSLALGIESVLILLMHQKAKEKGKRLRPEYEIKISQKFSYVLIAFLVAGVCLEIFFSIF